MSTVNWCLTSTPSSPSPSYRWVLLPQSFSHPPHPSSPSPLSLSPQIDKELVLLSVLKEPVSRSIFDYALRSKDIASLFRHLLLRQKKRAGTIPECPTADDPAIAQLLKKLLSQVRKRRLNDISWVKESWSSRRENLGIWWIFWEKEWLLLKCFFF